MDPQKRTLIVTGLVLFLILAIIFGTIFFLIRALTQRVTTTSKNTNNPITSPNPANITFPVQRISPVSSAPPALPSTANRPTTAQAIKTFTGAGFFLQYPKTWGLLTCSNSQNFEFDPTNSADQPNMGCNRATKPVTVLVGQNTCVSGDIVTLGGTMVKKIKSQIVTKDGSGTLYHWCTQTTPALDITARVGSGTAFSSQDFSKEVEQVIASLNRGGGS